MVAMPLVVILSPMKINRGEIVSELFSFFIYLILGVSFVVICKEIEEPEGHEFVFLMAFWPIYMMLVAFIFVSTQSPRRG